MCGIIGFQGDFDGALLVKGTEQLNHRGPDGAGTFFSRNGLVGLGHTRLAIQDLSEAGAQPMTSKCGLVTIIYNGEIYNGNQLRARLSLAGYEFRGNSDTEVLLNLYLQIGSECVKQLNGIFAFAIFDGRSNKLFLARDALGVKPLYYYSSPLGTVFSSEMKPLFHFMGNDRDINIQAAYMHLKYLWCPGSDTMHVNVKKLEPGCALELDASGNVSKYAWFDIRYAEKDYDRNGSPEYYIDQTQKYLSRAVNRQLVSDVPVGAFLSGGLDSSAITAFAREEIKDLRCFTIETAGGVEGGTTDDLPYARKVATHLDVNLEVVSINGNQLADDFEWMVTQLDEPVADPASLNVFYISKLASQLDTKVLLSGTGGDDLFTGYRRHRALQLERYWAWLPTQARGMITQFTRQLDQGKTLNRRVTKAFSHASLSDNARLVGHFEWTSADAAKNLFREELRSDLLMIDSRGDALSRFIEKLPPSENSLQRMLLLEQRFFLGDHNLTYTDKMSMAAGVEARVPFLDRDLVAFSRSIPVRYKQRGGEGKWVLKKALESRLPKDVIYRPKTGFGAPVRKWINSDLSVLLRDTLSSEAVNKRGIFDSQQVDSLFKRTQMGEVDGSYTLLSLAAIEIWCRAFIDK